MIRIVIRPNAAGIQDTMIGYSNIPDYWMQAIEKVEDMNFQYTEMSLNKVYDIGFHHAAEMIKRNGGIENTIHLLKFRKLFPKCMQLNRRHLSVLRGTHSTRRALKEKLSEAKQVLLF
ncbi:hypothetical protein [uncultured Proteiniphilum sp.]|uniref:hypothetical protein n=1 Tax=uncultured Proteiniphilum sp. TaxID=497637 RepID=UPI002628B31A|nr:hypothetical protein [uncultured Proteiniphilum sp.]